jgi:hypothetical protein
MVADDAQGKADQDRREGRQPRALPRLPAGGSRHSLKPVRRHPTKYCRVAVAAGDVDSVSVPVCRVRAKPTGEVCLDERKFGSSRPLRAGSARWPLQTACRNRSVLPETPNWNILSTRPVRIWGMSVQIKLNNVTPRSWHRAVRFCCAFAVR